MQSYRERKRNIASTIRKSNDSSTTNSKGRFPVMAEITCKLAANTRRQFFCASTATASTRCLVENFQLILWLTVSNQIVKSLSLSHKKFYFFNMVQPIDLIFCTMVEIIE